MHFPWTQQWTPANKTSKQTNRPAQTLWKGTSLKWPPHLSSLMYIQISSLQHYTRMKCKRIQKGDTDRSLLFKSRIICYRSAFICMYCTYSSPDQATRTQDIRMQLIPFKYILLLYAVANVMSKWMCFKNKTGLQPRSNMSQICLLCLINVHRQHMLVTWSYFSSYYIEKHHLHNTIKTCYGPNCDTMGVLLHPLARWCVSILPLPLHSTSAKQQLQMKKNFELNGN